jgi:hypothetical protein
MDDFARRCRLQPSALGTNWSAARDGENIQVTESVSVASRKTAAQNDGLQLGFGLTESLYNAVQSRLQG